jgi:hypothetical protein
MTPSCRKAEFEQPFEHLCSVMKLELPYDIHCTRRSSGIPSSQNHQTWRQITMNLRTIGMF